MAAPGQIFWPTCGGMITQGTGDAGKAVNESDRLRKPRQYSAANRNVPAQRAHPAGAHNWGYDSTPVNKCRILLYAYLTALPRRNTHIHCSKFTIPPVTYVEIGRNIAAGISQPTYAAAFPAAERVGRGTAAGEPKY